MFYVQIISCTYIGLTLDVAPNWFPTAATTKIRNSVPLPDVMFAGATSLWFKNGGFVHKANEDG